MDFPLSSFRYPPFATTAHAARSHERRDVPWLNVCAAALLLAAVAVLLSEHSPSASAWRVRTTESLVAAYQTLVVGPRDGTKSIVHKTVDLSSLTEGDYVVITRDDCPACQILKGELSKSKGTSHKASTLWTSRRRGSDTLPLSSSTSPPSSA